MSVYNTSPQPTCLHRACLQGPQVAPTEQQSNTPQTCFRGPMGSLHASLHRGGQHSGLRQFKVAGQAVKTRAALQQHTTHAQQDTLPSHKIAAGNP